ncbi:hypothetical protein [Nonomuraea endophytica]|uniref:Uncharacterized protein n=1 Tax=Nonomuraea endophytica TaxID=714136 RepID=A0A7W8EKI6_9ACTN|nr:hypothetical protein [Nonomuraea endophytica]MBB5081852.1 hypothetical protein [Nonomuraea endophytica]
MSKHFFGDTAVLLGRSLRHITRSVDTIVTTAIMPIAMMLMFVYVFGGAIKTSADSYVNYLLPGIRRDLDLLEHSLLRAAREAGLRWRDIAGALGLDSPQAAQQRLARLDGRATAEEPGA